MVDEQGIIKSLITDIPVRDIPLNLLTCAKTFPCLETLRINPPYIFLEVTKTTICTDKLKLSQSIFDQLYNYLPKAETIYCCKAVDFVKVYNSF